MIEYRVIWWERMAGIADPVPFGGSVTTNWEIVVYKLEAFRSSPRTLKAFIEARPASDAPWPRFWDKEVVA